MSIIERPFDLVLAFRDPVHDFIKLSHQERYVIDTAAFQRLRRIHQLGPGYLVYHGAEHSRFGHALGTMEVATRIFEAIERKRPDALGSSPKERGRNWQLVRLAALLHDVGHAPFSHATEEIMPMGESGKPIKHESYTTAIIRSDPELSATIDQHFAGEGITADHVAAVIDALGDLGQTGVLLHQIISGELDGDRMDYLARDSLYTGASYGKFDVGRLLETITVARWTDDGPWLLAVEAGGTHAVEQLLLARYYMYVQVYLHDGRRFFDFALNNFLASVLPDGKYPVPEETSEYLKYDDGFVLERTREMAGENRWADAIWNRRPWKTVAYTEPHPDSVEVRAWSKRQVEIEANFDKETVLFDDADARFYHQLSLGPYSLATAEHEGRYPILIAEEGSLVGHPVENRSHIVRNLSEPIMLMRLYARPDVAEDVIHLWSKR